MLLFNVLGICDATNPTDRCRVIRGLTSIYLDKDPSAVEMIAYEQIEDTLADTDLLRTLPEREFRAGYAEIVKYGLIDDPEFFNWLDESKIFISFLIIAHLACSHATPLSFWRCSTNRRPVCCCTS